MTDITPVQNDVDVNGNNVNDDVSSNLKRPIDQGDPSNGLAEEETPPIISCISKRLDWMEMLITSAPVGLAENGIEGCHPGG